MGFFSHLAVGITAVFLSIAAFFGFGGHQTTTSAPVSIPTRVAVTTSLTSVSDRSTGSEEGGLEWVPVPTCGATGNTRSLVCYRNGKVAMECEDGSGPFCNVVSIADPSSLLEASSSGVVDSEFLKDSKQVYTMTGAIKGADPKTFRLIWSPDGSWSSWAKDAHHVYGCAETDVSPAIYCSLVSGADPATFKPVGDTSSFGKDATHVFMDPPFSGKPALVTSADPASFVVSTSSVFGTIEKDSRHVFFGPNLVAGADPNTFTVLPFGFAKDDAHVYAIDSSNQMNIVPNISPNKFAVVLGLDGPGKNTFSDYVKDASGVYKEVDATTTSWLKLSGADSASFRAVPNPYSPGWWGYSIFTKDKSHVYFTATNKMIPGADPATFRLVGDSVVPEPHLKDALLTGIYAKDASHVYWVNVNGISIQLTLVQGADAASFAIVPPPKGYRVAITEGSAGVLKGYDAFDKNHKYLMGKIVQ